MAPSTSEQSQVLQDMLQDDHKCRGVSMERVWSGSRTKEVHVCMSLRGPQKGDAWSTMQEGISVKMGNTRFMTYRRIRADWREHTNKRGELQVTQQQEGSQVDRQKSKSYTRIESEN